MKKQLLFIVTLIASLFISQIGYSTNDTVNTVGATGFSPSNLSINIGDSVTFVNTGGFHNVNGTILTFPSNPANFFNLTGVSAGWTFVQVFTLPGTYNYQCDPHIPAMVGVINVTAPITPLISSISYNDPLCFGGATGSDTVFINQTIPVDSVKVTISLINSITGAWSQIGTSLLTTSSIFPHSSLSSGSYGITLLNSSGATLDTMSFTLVDPPFIDINVITVSNPITPSSNDGSIDISVSGGTGSLDYSWDNGSSSEDINNLAPGQYIITVTDSIGCDNDALFNLTAISSCYAGDIDTNNVTCYLSFDGEISISNAFGVYPLTFSLDTANPYMPGYVPSLLYQDTIISNSSFFFDNLIKGNYFITFKDASNCIDSSILNMPYQVDRSGDPFVIDTIINSVSDTGLLDGSFVLNVIQGGFVVPYNFIWYDSLGNVLQDSSLNSLSNLGEGSYSVVISDNSPNNCESEIYSLVMGLRQSCNADSSITHNICPGSNEGSAKINYLNGWNDYQFYDSAWNPLGIPNMDSIWGLSAGNYHFRLDSLTLSSCPVDTIEFEILEPIINDIYIVDAVNGNNLCTGDSSRIFVDLFTPDPNATYYYYIDGSLPGQLVGDSTVDYFSSGTYNLGLQYFNGIGLSSCLNSPGYSSTPFIIDEFNLSINGAFTTDEFCGVSSATLAIDIDSINVSNFPVSFFINGDSIMSSINSTGTFNIPHSVIYDSIYIEDALGCKVYWDFPLMAEQIINTTIIDTNIIKESCRGNDGEINLLLDNGQGFYNYTLSKAIPFNIPSVIESGVTSTPVSASISIDSLVAGTYFIEITDDSSCVSLSTFVVDQVVPFTLLPLTKVKETCCGYDGSIQVNINPGDGVNLTYTLEFDTIQITIEAANNVYPYTIDNAVWPSQSYLTSFNKSQSSSYFDSLTRGYYSIYVEDEFGCVDSVDYSTFITNGSSGPNTHLRIDDTYVTDMSYSYTDIVCFGDTNATLKVLYPDACYSYELLLYSDTANPLLIAVDSISFPDTSVYYNELYAGIYGIQAMSTSGFSGCVRRSDTFQIIEPDVISYDSPLSTPAFCLNNGFAIDGGACNGTVRLPNSPIGGVYDTSVVLNDTVYQYYINRINSTVNYFQGPIVSDSIFSGLCPGDYEVQVLDGNNCIIKDTVSVGDNSLYIDSLLVTSISCHDSSDATIQVYAHGGIGVYDYVWTDSSPIIVGNTQLVDSLLEGMYFVTVSDSAGCYSKDSAFISSAPDQLELYGRVSGFESEETCYGYSYNGHVGYEVRGGSGPYVFSWINSDASRTGSYTAYAQYCSGCISSDGISSIDSVYILDSLTTDIYKVTLTDVNGCSSITNFLPIDSISITALNINNPLSIDSILGSDTLCYGASNGDIMFYMNDSTLYPLIFELDSNLSIVNDSLVNSTGNFSSLSANTYNILITDALGCFIKDTYTIMELDEIVVNDSIIDLSCYESDDGQIFISVLGGSGTYDYSWNNGASSSSLSNLTIGTYVLSINDDYGCLAFDTVNVFQPDPLQSSIVVTSDALCNGSSDAYGSISVSGGTPAYQYSWSVGSSSDSTISNVPAGTYTVLVTDANNCQDDIDVIFEEPSIITLKVDDISNNLCFGDSQGSITLSAYGGVPNYVTYFIESSLGVISSQSSNIFTNLLSDNYNVWVKDANGCLSDKLISEKVGEPGRIQLTPIVTPSSCFESNDGIINLIFENGVAPYNYQLSNINGAFDNGIVFQHSDSLIVENLSEGDYYFEVIDYNNCEDSISVKITQPSDIIANFSIDEDLILERNTVTVTNLSTGANYFSWNFGDDSSNSNEFELTYKYHKQGNFIIELIASNNNLSEMCNDTAWLNIAVEGYDINNVFSPNNDGVNDEYHFGDEMLVELRVAIYNRWGQQVYAFNDAKGSWDGIGFNGELMPEGVYFFTMEAIGSLGDSYIEEGTITLLR
ncbi:MAG: Plastocyanin [Cryomorphaceae bacterium]|nr:MAG: Plastocyanin [Cryomorphaceae bacterium]